MHWRTQYSDLGQVKVQVCVCVFFYTNTTFSMSLCKQIEPLFLINLLLRAQDPHWSIIGPLLSALRQAHMQ